MPARAHATLLAGCDFITRHSVHVSDAPDHWEKIVRKRLIANQLRELDNFLSILLKEVAAMLSGADHDPVRFARLSNNAKKLRAVERMARLESRDDAWLRAIGGLAVRLRRTARAVSTIRESIDDGQPVSLRSIAEFYRNLAHRLAIQVNQFGQIIDFHSSETHIEKAIVAYDGF